MRPLLLCLLLAACAAPTAPRSCVVDSRVTVDGVLIGPIAYYHGAACDRLSGTPGFAWLP